MVTAIAMTEPGAGSDLQGVKTTAVLDGDEYVINGSKTFITNGYLADLVIVVAKTDPKAGAKGTSLFLVEADTPGFDKGKRLEKVGMKAQDTSELFFQDVRVPKENLLGQAGMGFAYLMQELPQERLTVAIGALSSAEAALQWTLEYTRERKAFGKAIADFQNTRFKLAEMATEIQIGRVFVDKCMAMHLEGKLDVPTAAMAKYWATDLQCKVLDECVQLHGGYGFMWEYPIARAWADARVQRIYAGTNEIMKEIIARALWLIVPTLRVGTPHVTLRVTTLRADAERPRRHSHAERGNDQCGSIKVLDSDDPSESPQSLPTLLSTISDRHWRCCCPAVPATWPR